MAMSDTGSSLANWSDDLYHYAASPGLSLGAMHGGEAGAADSTIGAAYGTGATAATPTSPAASAGSGDGSPSRAGSGTLGPRAAGKPSAARKRARASRRAPVTMLNTDAANFRAMVQQFTGIPAPPAGPVIDFGVPGYGFAPQQPAAALSFDRIHHHRQQYAGGATTFGYGNSSQQYPGAGDDVFAHGFGSAEDRMLLQSMQAAHTMPAANHGANGYFC